MTSRNVNNILLSLAHDPEFLFRVIHERNALLSMEMSFFAMPSHRSEQWAFQNGAHRLVP